MARRVPPRQQRHAMNNVVARSIVCTLIKAATETHRRNIPSLTPVHQTEMELSLVAIVMQASFLETWMNFADSHWGLALPTKKPPIKPGAKHQKAGIEYRLNAMLQMAKAKLPTFRLSRIERKRVIQRLNDAKKAASTCVRIRNKVAHGQPFAAVKENGQVLPALSKVMRGMTLAGLKEMIEEIGVFTSFCEIMLDPHWPVRRLAHKKWILSDVLRVAIDQSR